VLETDPLGAYDSLDFRGKWTLTFGPIMQGRSLTTRGLTMRSDQDDLEEFRRLLAHGSVQRAYRAVLSFMSRLRAHFENNLADCATSDFFQGDMDITYFAVVPSLLKQYNLKVAVVFN
jgi:hypothetical protein